MGKGREREGRGGVCGRRMEECGLFFSGRELRRGRKNVKNAGERNGFEMGQS